jgi:hypothetical protein
MNISKISFYVIFLFLFQNWAFEINAVNNFGYNFVDIESAVGSSKYDESAGSTQTFLKDWDFYHYKGGAQILLEKSDELKIGVELTFNRLYYWEEQYYNSSVGANRWRWGTIWTMQIGAVAKYLIQDPIYVQGGVSLHRFLDGSGASFGLTVGGGYNIELNDTFSIPLDIRTDIIFGNATSFALGSGFVLSLHP